MFKFSRYLTEITSPNRFGDIDPEHYLPHLSAEDLKAAGSDDKEDHFAKLNNAYASIIHHIRHGHAAIQREDDYTKQGWRRTAEGIYKPTLVHHETGEVLSPEKLIRNIDLPASSMEHANKMVSAARQYSRRNTDLTKKILTRSIDAVYHPYHHIDHKLATVLSGDELVGNLHSLGKGVKHVSETGATEPHFADRDERGEFVEPTDMPSVRNAFTRMRHNYHFPLASLEDRNLRMGTGHTIPVTALSHSQKERILHQSAEDASRKLEMIEDFEKSNPH
jgi:hypothetical protein